MSKKRVSENISNLLKTKGETLTVLTKENIVLKHDRKIKISFIDLTPFLNEQFGFIDPDFPHVYTSINENEIPPHQSLSWLPAEEVHPNSNYSDLIRTIETNLFNKKSISYAVIIINWFQKIIFEDIFLQELSHYHLYSYDVMVDGIFMNIPIDSYIPINSTTKKEIFTANHKGSIFPCLYQKLLAKIYGDYESITSEFIDIVELQTMYCRQEVSLVGKVKQKQILEIIRQKIGEGSIISFRTRNSIRLQSFGLQSNYIYIILRVFQKQQDLLIQFLQLDGESWIGKHSKLRSGWLLEQQIIQQKRIILNQEHKQNYMSLSDMKGIGRELIILNNTINYHKNYFVSQNNLSYFNMYRLTFEQTNKCMMRANFKHKKCYNSIYFISKTENQTYKLLKTVFNENKQSIYLEYSVNPGEYFVIIYNTHPQEETLPYNFTLFTSHQFVQIQPVNNMNDTLQILENAFLSYFAQIFKFSQENLFFRQLYSSTGLAFIYIKSPQNPLSVTLNNKMLQDRKIYCVNLNPLENQFIATFPSGHCNLIIFRCLWSKKQNIDFDHENINSKEEVEKIVFPPIGSVKVTQKIKK